MWMKVKHAEISLQRDGRGDQTALDFLIYLHVCLSPDAIV